MRLLTLALLPCLALAAPVCHKNHQTRDYKMTHMPSPALLSGIGESHLKIPTKSAKAQSYFDQGLNLLHCFWDFEAHRAFKEAAGVAADPGVTMGGTANAIATTRARKKKKRARRKKPKALREEASYKEK